VVSSCRNALGPSWLVMLALDAEDEDEPAVVVPLLISLLIGRLEETGEVADVPAMGLLLH
jgi:hypothetical protein